MKQKKIPALLLVATIVLSSTTFVSASNNFETIDNSQESVLVETNPIIYKTDKVELNDGIESRAVTATTTANVNLRKSASTKSESLLILNKGSKVTILDSTTDKLWAKVQYKTGLFSSVKGYVYKSYLNF